MKISFMAGAVLGATATALVMKKTMSGNSMYKKGKDAVKKKIEEMLD